MSTAARGFAEGESKCREQKLASDINRVCPSELAVRAAAARTRKDGGGDDAVVGCKSACLAFGTNEYCCRGQYASPATCKPSGYSKLFKAQCPQAYSYAYDDRSSTFTCNGTVDYSYAGCHSPESSRRRRLVGESPRIGFGSRGGGVRQETPIEPISDISIDLINNLMFGDR